MKSDWEKEGGGTWRFGQLSMVNDLLLPVPCAQPVAIPSMWSLLINRVVMGGWSKGWGGSSLCLPPQRGRDIAGFSLFSLSLN